MKKEEKVPMDEIFETYERLKDSLDDGTDARVVECACFILIAECNVALGVKTTDIEKFENTVRPVILQYMELFQEKKPKAKILKK